MNLVFRVLDSEQTHFYDFDCLEYDSRETQLLDNVHALRERINDLHHMEYNYAMLVTHSTGGILALQMLTNTILDENNIERSDISQEIILAPNGIRLPAVQAWATPINGLRWHIRTGGGLLTLIGYSPETLPELAPDSTYLSNLKSRLQMLNSFPTSSLSDEASRRINDVSVNFYHGQEDDLIVHEIDRRQGRNDGWLWPRGRGELIHTETGHSHNVADSGEVGLPRFPARTMELEALLRIPFSPRYAEVFPPNLQVVPAALELRQMQIIRSLIFYARNNFSSAVLPARQLISRMLINRYDGARSKNVDLLLLRELLHFFREKTPDNDFVRFLIGFGRNVLTRYDPTGPEDVTAPGFNEIDSILAMQKLLMATLDDVLTYLKQKSIAEQNELLSQYRFSSLRQFWLEMQAVIGVFSHTEYHTVRKQALADARREIERSTPDVLRNSPLLGSLKSFYSENYFKIAQDEKSSIFENIELVMQKDPLLRADILRDWSVRVPYFNKELPLWATLNDDAIVAEIVSQMHTTTFLEPAEWQFLADVASIGGARGNSLDVAKRAEQSLAEAIASDRIVQRFGTQFIDILKMSSRTAVYPLIGKRLLEDAKELNARGYDDSTRWRISDEHYPTVVPIVP